MAGYTVLANRYRPRTFADVVGQGDAARVLQQSIRSGRAGHAFLFSGPRGVGKTSMARILAKALNCLEDETGAFCGRCRVCRSIDETGDSLDVVEIDGASHNKVENVRDLIENLRFRPVEARFRIYIVDEVHMLSTSAFNALLKTLEEPPGHAKFILCTTEPLKVPETIRSRCQQFEFRRLTAATIRDRLAAICEQEGVPAAPGLLESVARHAKGGMRDALSLLDQLITFGDGRPSLEDYQRLTGRLSPELLGGLVAATLAADTRGALEGCERALAGGARAADLLEQLTEVLEGLLVVTAGGRPADRTPEEEAALAELAASTNTDHVIAMLDVMVEATRRLKQRHDGRLVVELAVLTLARLPLLEPIEALLEGGPGAPDRGGEARAPHAAATVSGGGEPRTRSSGAPPSAARPARQDAPPAPAAGGRRAPGAGSARAAPGSHAGAEPSRDQPPVGPSAAGDAFRTQLLEEVGKSSRSLRLELAGYRRVQRIGDELHLVPPEDHAGGLFHLDRNEFLQRVREAAQRVAGRRLEVRLDAQLAPAPPPAPTGDAVQDAVFKRWPGAEQVDM